MVGNRKLVKPDFFIIGAPRCGTTALSQYLGENPQVFMCKPKEPGYFATDFPKHRYVKTWEDYLDLFSPVECHHRAVGEASALYLYSAKAIEKLLSAIPDAKLIVMIRHPVYLAMSMHATALYNLNEDVRSFDTAWKLRNSRRKGQRVPRDCREVKTLFYGQIAMLGRQLERLLDHASYEQVRWWFYDDFQERPGEVYREVLSFIGVEDDNRSSFEPVNSRKSAKSKVLARLTQRPPAFALQAKRRLGLNRWSFLKPLRELNSSAPSKARPSREVVDEMYDFFEDDIRLTERITGRNLEYWFRYRSQF